MRSRAHLPALPAALLALAAPGFSAAATATPEPRDPPTIANSPRRGFTAARLRPGQSVLLRSAPDGRAVTRVGSRTEFGSRRVLAIVAVRKDWLGVTTVERRNGRLAWIRRRSDAITLQRISYWLRVDLSARRLDLLRGRRVVRRIAVAVGRPGSSTPTGRFGVTDRLRGRDYGGYYGCCILALSGTQPNLPRGWRGGDRLAVHGTDAPATVGRATSAGCLRAHDRDLRVLMRRVRLGTPVFIRR